MAGPVVSARRFPVGALCAAALAGTIAATYPLFLGRSLVSPGNGPTLLLYDGPPFTYGASDMGFENVRGTDVGAMMWGVLPYTIVQREAISRGEWPLWNRYNANGQPLWGQGQTFFLDPAQLLSLAIADPSVAMDVRFIAGRAVFALGTGVAVLLVTGSLPAAAILAFVAPFVGHFTSRFNHPAYFSIVYAPWVLAALAFAMRASTPRERARATVALTCATWLQLVGSTPKEGAAAVAALYVVGLVATFRAGARRSDVLGRLDVLLGSGLLALLAAAPHWLIFLDTLSRSWTAYGRPLVEFASAPHAVAFALGALAPGQPFTGGHPLLLVSAACALSRPAALLRSPLGAGCTVSLALFVAVAFGAVPAGLLARLPLVANIHHVWDAFLAAVIPSLLLLAGIGIAAVLDERQARSGWRTTALAIVAAACGAWLVPGALPDIVAAVGLLAVSGALLAVVALRWVSAFRPLWIGLGITMAIAAGGLHVETGNERLDSLLMQPRIRADLTTPSPALVAAEAAASEPFRAIPVESVFFPGTQAYWGIEALGGPDALRLTELESLGEASGLERTSWLWRFVLHPPAAATASHLLDMLNVRYLVARADQVPAGGTVLPLDGADQIRVVRRDSAWPRAFFTAAVQHHRDIADFSRLLQRSSGPFASVDERDETAGAATSSLPDAGAVAPATQYVLTVNSTTFHVSSLAPGLAVLGESFVEKDFEATLNGEPVPYIRVNHGFKAVVIPGPGEWTVRFTYRPASWQLSWALAGVGATAAFALLLVRDPRSLPDQGTGSADVRS